MSGRLVDSTLVGTPKQRNTNEEKQDIKAGNTSAEVWPARESPSDIAIPSFGYNNHAGTDKAFRFIRR